VVPGRLWYKNHQEDGTMDFVEKAKIRLEHWISHSEHHHEEYEMFADQLDEAGKRESAEQIREMMKLSSRSTDCLRKALKALV
jgi:chemotaxis regulatin CheY-phosphate phosphatase CheZ